MKTGKRRTMVMKIEKRKMGVEAISRPEGVIKRPKYKKIAKRAAVLLTVFCLSFSLAGCGSGQEGSLKDNLIDGFDNFIQSFSKHALTKNKNLQGERVPGVDEYTGSYTADYDEFNGEEFLFGGTALERERGSNLKVSYTLEITSGSAVLYWISAGEERVITNDSGEDVYHLTLGSGDNYIALEGENFSGSLEVTVEDISVQEGGFGV